MNTSVTVCRCPMCNGSGKLKAPTVSMLNREELRRIAKSLQKQGFSISRITALMGYKSKRSAWLLLQPKKP